MWEKQIGQGFSGPAIAGDRLILFHRVDDSEVVECLDAATGRSRWKFQYPTAYRDDFGFDEGPRATPLIAENKVYTLGAEGWLHCVDLGTGKKLWGKSLREDYGAAKGFFGVGTSPLLENDLLIVNVGGKKGAGIVGLDKNTGREVWRATDHEASYSSPAAATIKGVRHCFVFTREGIVSLDPKTGAVQFSKRWRSRMHASVNAATPVIVNDQLFISASYGTGALCARVHNDRLEELWSGDDALSNHYGTSIHHMGHLYGFHGRQEYGAALRCIELKTGKVRWSQDRFGCGSMIYADGKLIILTDTGELVMAEATPDAYREKCRAAVLTGECRAPIALANGRLCGRDKKRLVCWNVSK